MLSMMDWLGCFIIMACVVLIGLGASQSDDGDGKVDTANLIYAVISALVTGLIFSINTMNVNYVIRDVKFPPN